MSEEIVTGKEAFVKGNNTTPAEIDVERAMHQARNTAGVVAKASIEVHGIPERSLHN